MKNFKLTGKTLLAVALLALPLVGCSKAEKKAEAAKPYPLDTCIVCGMKLGDPSKSIQFVYQGQEIRVCSGNDQRTFMMDPDPYMKKLADAGGAQAK